MNRRNPKYLAARRLAAIWNNATRRGDKFPKTSIDDFEAVKPYVMYQTKQGLYKVKMRAVPVTTKK